MRVVIGLNMEPNELFSFAPPVGWVCPRIGEVVCLKGCMYVVERVEHYVQATMMCRIVVRDAYTEDFPK